MSTPELTPADSVRAPVDRFRNLTRTPRLAVAAVGIVRNAAPRVFVPAVALQVVAAVLTAAQLLVANSLISDLVGLAASGHPATASIAPALGALLGVTVLAGVVTAVLAYLRQLLGELVGRHMTDRIIDVAAAVDLARFEDPAFCDHLQRATLAGTFRPIEMVNSLMTLLLGVLTSAGIVVVLFVLEPLLPLLVVLAGLPVLVATLRNSRQTYAFEYGMTSHARERLHLLELFTGPEAAKELRTFAAIRFLRRRYDALSDERIVRMRAFLRGRLRVLLVGTCASALGSPSPSPSPALRGCWPPAGPALRARRRRRSRCRSSRGASAPLRARSASSWSPARPARHAADRRQPSGGLAKRNVRVERSRRGFVRLCHEQLFNKVGPTPDGRAANPNVVGSLVPVL